MQMRVSVIIPVFNEESTITRVLEEVLAVDLGAHEVEVLVADDGSSDGTLDLLRPLVAEHDAIRLLEHTVNTGKSAAIRRALAAANGDVVIIQDADNEYSPGDFPALLEPFSDPEIKVVYGSRFLARSRPTGMKAPYWLANKLFTGTANLLYGARITDEGTAYKAIRRQTLDELELEASRFAFCAEVTAKLLRRGITIREVPITYRARTKIEGKKPGVLDAAHILWTLVRLRFTQPG